MYEYTVVTTHESLGFRQADLINKYASEGWKLVQVVQNNSCYDFFFYFERKR